MNARVYERGWYEAIARWPHGRWWLQRKLDGESRTLAADPAAREVVQSVLGSSTPYDCANLLEGMASVR